MHNSCKQRDLLGKYLEYVAWCRVKSCEHTVLGTTPPVRIAVALQGHECPYLETYRCW